MHFAVPRSSRVPGSGCHLGSKRSLVLPIHRCVLARVDRFRGRAVQASYVMSSAASVLAVVRAAAPSFRNSQDRLAFALHAAVLSSGYRLVAVGDQAQLDGLPANAPDADVAGWNSSSDQYTFAYLSEEDGGSTGSTAAAANSSPTKLLVKALVLGDTLLTTLATDSAAAEPQVLELSVEDYVIPPSSTDGSAAVAGGSIAKSYKNLDRLVTTLNTAMSKLVGSSPAAAAAGNPSSGSQKKQKTEVAAGASGHQGSRPPEPLQEPDPDHDPLRIGPPRRPVRVGDDDIMPIWGAGPSGGMLPGGPPLMGPTGGGMHVGPGHPFFADRMRHPELMPGRGLGGGGMPGGPGGMRWDPINPEGLEGWRPEDFQRPAPGRGRGGGIDPDIGQPGPGRGADWDNMFG